MLTDLQCAFLATYQMPPKTIESASAGYSRHHSRACLAIGHCPLSPTLSLSLSHCLWLSLSGRQGAVGAVKSPGEKQLNGSRAEPVTRAFLMDTIDRHKGGTASRQGERGEGRERHSTAWAGLKFKLRAAVGAALEDQQQKTNERRKEAKSTLPQINTIFIHDRWAKSWQKALHWTARDPGGAHGAIANLPLVVAATAAAGWLRVAIAKHCRRLPLPECGDNACSLC